MVNNKITPRKRLLTVLDGKIPDRIPRLDFFYSRPLFNEVLNMKIKDYTDPDSYKLVKHLRYDATTLTTTEQEDSFIDASADNVFTDHRGTVWKSDEKTWPISAPVGHTIKNREDFKDFKIPDGSKEYIF